MTIRIILDIIATIGFGTVIVLLLYRMPEIIQKVKKLELPKYRITMNILIILFLLLMMLQRIERLFQEYQHVYAD